MILLHKTETATKQNPASDFFLCSMLLELAKIVKRPLASCQITFLWRVESQKQKHHTKASHNPNSNLTFQLQLPKGP
jgi:hypothetical protein